MTKPEPQNWIRQAEAEIRELHEEITRMDAHGRHDYKLISRINELQNSIEAAKHLLSRPEDQE